MLPVTQIDTFYNELTLRHRDTINAAAKGTFMKRRPEECYDLIKKMTAHHNNWDTSARRENYNSGGNAYQPKGDRNLLSYRSNNFLGPPDFSPLNNQNQDQVLPESTTCVPPLVVQPCPSSRSSEIPPSLVSTSSELPKQNPYQPPIPYPSRLNKEKPQDKFDIQVHKFLQLFKQLHFNISLVDSSALMPKINLMPLYVWKKLMLPELIHTHMTLELANRSVAYPAGIAEDVYVQVDKFTFPADFVVIVIDVDPHVPLILGRPFLRTDRALVDVYREELILRDVDEKLIFHVDSTLKHPQKHGNDTTFSSYSSLSLIPFGTSDSLLEEFANELTLLDPFLPGNEDDNFDLEADLREIEYLLY
nr:reverse transcriptase domain-containing protein [Tanacetum cinerariifolium]